MYNQNTGTGSSASAAGLLVWSGSSATGVNNIIRDNISSNNANYTGAATLTYTCASPMPSGEGNMDEDPLFLDPSNDDFNLTETSPCIDAGDPNSPLDPDDTVADMGALYFHTLDVNNGPDQVPVSFEVLSAYPNPFNPETTVAFTLNQPDRISIQVFNTAGSLVANLAEGHYTSGRHQVVFQGNHLPSGLYFARFETSAIQQTQKLLLIK